MNFEIVPAHELTLAEQATVFNNAFAGYVAGSFHMDASSLAAFMSGHGVDLCYSRFARNDQGELVSFGFLNRTGNITRLAGMGTVPAARRSGAGTYLMSHLLNEAKTREDVAMVLEVIEQNPPAVGLYRACGFRQVSRLFGWRTTTHTTRSAAPAVQQIPITEGVKLATPLDYPDLPWQISRHAAAKVASGRAFVIDNTAIVIGGPNVSPVRIHAFLGCDGHNWELFRTLVSSLLANFPDQEFFAPAVYPEQFGTEVFEPLGFSREPLNQFLMRKDL